MKSTYAEFKVLDFTVKINFSAGWYIAHAPKLLGCVAVERTVDNVEKSIREAIFMHIITLRAKGLPVPRHG